MSINGLTSEFSLTIMSERKVTYLDLSWHRITQIKAVKSNLRPGIAKMISPACLMTGEKRRVMRNDDGDEKTAAPGNDPG